MALPAEVTPKRVLALARTCFSTMKKVSLPTSRPVPCVTLVVSIPSRTRRAPRQSAAVFTSTQASSAASSTSACTTSINKLPHTRSTGRPIPTAGTTRSTPGGAETRSALEFALTQVTPHLLTTKKPLANAEEAILTSLRMLATAQSCHLASTRRVTPFGSSRTSALKSVAPPSTSSRTARAHPGSPTPTPVRWTLGLSRFLTVRPIQNLKVRGIITMARGEILTATQPLAPLATSSCTGDPLNLSSWTHASSSRPSSPQITRALALTQV